jgi:hypothetical protein
MTNIFCKWKHEPMKYPIAWSLLAVAMVGCGEVSPKDSDPDAGADGPAAEKTVKVRVTGVEMTGTNGTGLPDANAIAVFTKPDGTVVQAGKVNAQGEAEAVVPEGSTLQTLQVIEPTATTRTVYIMTFHDVKPGDVIKSGLPRALVNTRNTSTTMNASFTFDQSYSYTFNTECSSPAPTTSPFVLTFFEGCHGDVVDILGIQTSVLTPPGPTRFALTRPDYVAGGNVTLNANWQNMANFVATMSNLPDDISSLSMRRSTFMRDGAVSAIAPLNVSLGDPPAGSAAGSIPYAPGVGKRAAIVATLSKGVRTYANQQFEVQTADIAGAETIDYNELSVPWVSPLTYTAAERKLSWTETPSGSGSPDIRVAAFGYRHIRDTITYTVYSYDIARPTVTPSIVVSGLPAAYAEFDPTQQAAAAFVVGVLAYVDQNNVNGYDDARKLGIGIISGVGSNDLFPDQAYRRRSTTSSVVVRPQ